MVLDPIPQSLFVYFFGSRPQPPTSLLIYVLCIARRYHQSLCVLDEDMHLACPMSRMSHLSTNETSTWQMRHEHCLMGHTSCVCHFCVCLMGAHTKMCEGHVDVVWKRTTSLHACGEVFALMTHIQTLSLCLSHTHTHTYTLTLSHSHSHTHKHTRMAYIALANCSLTLASSLALALALAHARTLSLSMYMLIHFVCMT